MGKEMKESKHISNEMLAAGGKDAGVLERFMKEFFPWGECRRAGMFNKQIRTDYYAQALWVCKYFGYKSVFEYGAYEIRCHISYAEGERPKGTPFIEVTPSIYD
jgi:hypothetical protein